MFRAILASLLTLPALALPPAAVDFERQVLPILAEKCFKCHSDEIDKPKAGIKLDSREAILEQIAEGAIVASDPGDSDLVWVMELDPADEDVMPPAKENDPVTLHELAIVKAWIEQGASLGEFTRYDRETETARTVVDAAEAADPAKAAAKIDALVEKALARDGREVNPPVDDAVFLRRIYLDLIGRNPTPSEARAFLDNRSAGKRADLIDQLLASDGHVSHAFNYWADALRAQSKMHRISGDAFFAWLKENLAANTPYDRLVGDMLSARGRFWKNPPTAYYLRDEGNKFAGVEATSALFLGTEIGCAQCHDHPYDRWTQREYHEFAGFYTAATTFMPKDKRLKNFDAQIVEKHRGEFRDWSRLRGVALKQIERGEDAEVPPFPELPGVSPEIRERIEAALTHEHPGRARDFGLLSYTTLAQNVGKHVTKPGKYHTSKLPDDFREEDGEPGERVLAKFLFGETPEQFAPDEMQDLLADWVTATDNPRFTKVVANRLWTWMTGVSLLGPLDAIVEVRKSADPDLVHYLEGLMEATGYDLQQFLRILANTRYYQSATSFEPYEVSTPTLLAGPLLRRLEAQQVWDSLVVLIDDEIDSRVETSQPDFSYVDAIYEAKDPDDYWGTMLDEWERRGGNSYDNQRAREREVKKLGFSAEGLERASELPQPAPDGHFLRIFGQSNRELIDNGWDNPTVPQALTLMNGPLFELATGEKSSLSEALAAARTPEEKVETTFLAILSRRPEAHETALVLEALPRDESGQPSCRDLAWSLINTRQFLFRP